MQGRILSVDLGESKTALVVMSGLSIQARSLLDLSGLDKGDKLLMLYRSLTGLVEEYGVERMVCERSFFQRSYSARFRGFMDGIVWLVSAQRDVPLEEISNVSVRYFLLGQVAHRKKKKELKPLIQGEIRRIFSLDELPDHDTADALAVGLYYLCCGCCDENKECERRKAGWNEVSACVRSGKDGINEGR